MIPILYTAGKGFMDIGLREADSEAEKHGACEVREYMVPINEWYLNGSQRFKPMFRYYFKPDGTEIGYFTYPLNQVLFHEKSRVWDAGYKAALMKDRLIPADNFLALGTPEREEQETYFGEGQEPKQEDDDE